MNLFHILAATLQIANSDFAGINHTDLPTWMLKDSACLHPVLKVWTEFVRLFSPFKDAVLLILNTRLLCSPNLSTH